MERTPQIEKIRKGIGKALEAKLNKIYTPSSRFDEKFKGNSITFFTNEHGEPYSLYIGERTANGSIKGEFYSRRIKKREGGKIILSHWDNQGKVSGKHF
ncbi:MAG: hypothetical protein H7329_01760 [Opitutaceae bacterium]|nr:hypothetical protein [Cytophagales bacterium]